MPASAASLIQTGIHAADPATRQQALTVMDAINRTSPAAAASAFTSADRKRLDIFHALAPVASPDALEAELGLPDAKAIAAKQTLAAEGKKQAKAVSPGEIIFGAFGPAQDQAGQGAAPPLPPVAGAVAPAATPGLAADDGASGAGQAVGATATDAAPDAAAASAGGADAAAAGGTSDGGQAASAASAAPAAATAPASPDTSGPGEHSAATAVPAGSSHALPTLPPVPGMAGALQNDFTDNYGEAFAAVRRPDPAKKLAIGWIKHNWGVTNSGSQPNTIAQYPPEQYFPAQPASSGDGAAATPANGADHSWLHDQLAVSVQNNVPGATAFGLLPVPGQTAAEVAAGQPPSYQVWYRDAVGRPGLVGDGSGRALQVTFSADSPSSGAAAQPDPTHGGLLRQVGWFGPDFRDGLFDPDSTRALADAIENARRNAIPIGPPGPQLVVGPDGGPLSGGQLRPAFVGGGARSGEEAGTAGNGGTAEGSQTKTGGDEVASATPSPEPPDSGAQNPPETGHTIQSNQASAVVPFTGLESGIDARTSPIGLLKQWMRDFARRSFANKTVQNSADGSQILIPWQSIQKATTDRASRSALVAMGKLGEIISAGVPVRQEPDRYGRPDIVAYHYYRTKITIDGSPATIEIAVREMRDGRRYYDHYEIKEGPAAGADP